MTRRSWHARRPLTLGRSLVVWSVLALIAWLDRDGCLVAQQAAIFGFIISALSWLADALGVVGGAIASTLEGVVLYLVNAVSWLVVRVGNIVFSTGALFAKAWEHIRLLWSNVLRPALTWLDEHITRLRAWLKDTFGPVFKFLRAVRDEVTSIYKRFFRPILDTIDFIRALNRALLAFHIKLLQGLDNTLEQLERRLEEPLLWIYGKLNELTNWVNVIVTADGFFQRYTLLRSLARDVVYQWRILVNAGARPLTGDEASKLKRATVTQTQPALYSDLAAYLNGEQNDVGDVIDGIAANMQRTFDSFT